MAGAFELADVWLLAAMLSVEIAYVEGGRVSREIGGAATLCWAIILLAPLAAIPLFVEVQARAWQAVPWSAWIGFWSVGGDQHVPWLGGLVSWPRGLRHRANRPLNLAQPVLALLWSAILLGERVTWPFIATALVVIVSMAICIRSRIATSLR